MGGNNLDVTTVPPMAIRRNTSTLNGTFTGDRSFTSSLVSADARRRKDIALTCDSGMAPRYCRASTFGSAANALDGLSPEKSSTGMVDVHSASGRVGGNGMAYSEW